MYNDMQWYVGPESRDTIYGMVERGQYDSIPI